MHSYRGANRGNLRANPVSARNPATAALSTHQALQRRQTENLTDAFLKPFLDVANPRHGA